MKHEMTITLTVRNEGSCGEYIESLQELLLEIVEEIADIEKARKVYGNVDEMHWEEEYEYQIKEIK